MARPDVGLLVGLAPAPAKGHRPPASPAVGRWPSITRRRPRTRVSICRVTLGHSDAGEANRFLSLGEGPKLVALPRPGVSEDLSVVADSCVQHWLSH